MASEGDDLSARFVSEPVLVKQIKKELYYDRKDQALMMYTDVYATGYYWDLNESWDNRNGDNDITEKSTMKIGRINRSGHEIEAHFEIGASYGGFSASVGGSFKSFGNEEMSTEHTRETAISIRQGTALYLYQKVYTFETITWFRLDAWNKDMIVYKEGGRSILEVNGTFESKSKETRTPRAPLKDKEVAIVLKGHPGEVVAKTGPNIGYERTTEKCKLKLAPLGSLLY